MSYRKWDDGPRDDEPTVGTQATLRTGAIAVTGPVEVTGPVAVTGPIGATGALEATGAVGMTGALEGTGALESTGAAGMTGALENTGAAGMTGAVEATGPGAGDDDPRSRTESVPGSRRAGGSVEAGGVGGVAGHQAGIGNAQRLQLVGTARRQRQTSPAPGQRVGQRRTNAGRGADQPDALDAPLADDGVHGWPCRLTKVSVTSPRLKPHFDI